MTGCIAASPLASRRIAGVRVVAAGRSADLATAR
jgi:hypothetical protein